MRNYSCFTLKTTVWLIMKEKYPVSGFTRDKESIYVNGIRILVPAKYKSGKMSG